MSVKAENAAPKIESQDLSLGDLFKDFYLVPDFQREYVWEPENVEKLLTDIFDEFYQDTAQPVGDSEYFIGSIVSCPDNSGTYQLIDGQQRLTSIYLIVCAIRDRLVELGESAPETLQNFIKSVSGDRRTMEDIFRYRLTLQYEDSHGVLETIADAKGPVSSIPLTTESIKHIVAAYSAIQEFVVVNFGDDAQGVKMFLAAFMYRVKLIRIVTPNLAHALKVFETINDRGVSLNAMDLLKNLLFMKTNANDYQKLKEQWKLLTDTLGKAGEKPLRFLRYFILSQYETDINKPLREDEIYNWFVENNERSGINNNPIIFLKVLVSCAEAYQNFLLGKDAKGNTVPYIKNISLLAGGAVRLHLIMLLTGQNLAPELFAKLCKNIENLFFCYLITREQTKTFERNFIQAANALRTVKTQQELDDVVRQYFHVEMSNRRERFDHAFSELSESKIQKYRMRYILAKMTQFIEQQAFGNPAFASLDLYINNKVEIEHILPKSPSSDLQQSFDKPEEYQSYVTRLGNLTLLEQTINGANQNRPFADKKQGYRESHFLLTKVLDGRPEVGRNTSYNRAVQDFPEFDGWNSEAIERRQQALLQLAHRIWMADIETEGND